jgi:hypothetical protein
MEKNPRSGTNISDDISQSLAAVQFLGVKILKSLSNQWYGSVPEMEKSRSVMKKSSSGLNIPKCFHHCFVPGSN